MTDAMAEKLQEDEKDASAAWGCDLGTDTTSACVVVNNEPEAVMIDGKKSMPSAVYITYVTQQAPEVAALTDEVKRFELDPPEQFYVGQKAIDLGVLKANLILNSKSFIGRDYTDRYVQELAKKAAFAVVKAANGEVEFEIHGRRFSPQFIAALILRYVQKAVQTHVEAKLKIPVKVNEMALGIPANFGAKQRKRTMQAAAMANLSCHRLLNEPTAVAYAHVVLCKNAELAYRLILDLGGGTFDVTFVHYDHELFDMCVLNKAGDNDLGGVHLTTALAEYAISKYGRNADTLTADDRHKIFAAAERAKRSFTDPKVQKENIRCQLELPGKKYRVFQQEITRKQFRKVLLPFLERLKEPIEKVMTENIDSWNKLEYAIPNGQATKLPEVMEFFKHHSGKELRHEVDLETGVSTGVALWAGGFSTHHLKNEINEMPEPVDVTAFDLGVKQGVCEMAVMIERNTPIPISRPVKKEFYFGRNRDGTYKNEIEIDIFEGNSNNIYHNTRLGGLTLRRTPKEDCALMPMHADEREQHRIEVEFRIDNNNVITVSARAVWSNDFAETQFDGAVNPQEAEERKAVETLEVGVEGNAGESADAGSENAMTGEDGELAEEQSGSKHSSPSSPSSKRHPYYDRRYAAATQREILTEMGGGNYDFRALERASLSEGEDLEKQAVEARDRGDAMRTRTLLLKTAYIYACTEDSDCEAPYDILQRARELLSEAKLMQRRIKAGVGKTVEHFTIDIQEDELDWNYERLFKCMFADNFKTVIYQDPFIYDMHHIRKLNYLLDVFTYKMRSFDTFYLITRRDRRSYSLQSERFDELRTYFAKYTDVQRQEGISFEVFYEDKVHDRMMNTDSGWRVTFGTGIDIYRGFMPKWGPGATSPNNIRTRASSVDLFKLTDKTHYLKALKKCNNLREECEQDISGPPPSKQARQFAGSSVGTQSGANFEPRAENWRNAHFNQQPYNQSFNTGGMPGGSNVQGVGRVQAGTPQMGNMAGYGYNAGAGSSQQHGRSRQSGSNTTGGRPSQEKESNQPSWNPTGDDW